MRHTTNTDGESLTVAELAIRWKVSERTIRRLIADGGIGVLRLTRSVRIPLVEVERVESENFTPAA